MGNVSVRLFWNKWWGWLFMLMSLLCCYVCHGKTGLYRVNLVDQILKWLLKFVFMKFYMEFEMMTNCCRIVRSSFGMKLLAAWNHLCFMLHLTLICSARRSSDALGNGQNIQVADLLAPSKSCSFNYINGKWLKGGSTRLDGHCLGHFCVYMIFFFQINNNKKSPMSISQFCTHMASLCL
jgi:hypothetical protein